MSDYTWLAVWCQITDYCLPHRMLNSWLAVVFYEWLSSEQVFGCLMSNETWLAVQCCRPNIIDNHLGYWLSHVWLWWLHWIRWQIIAVHIRTATYSQLTNSSKPNCFWLIIDDFFFSKQKHEIFPGSSS